MKKLLLLAFAICMFAACSKDDDGAGVMPEMFDVISFEPGEAMIDLVTNKPLVLKDVTMNLYNIGDYTFHNVFCGKDYVPAPPENFDNLLFSTKDGGIRFGSYYANGFDMWGGFALSTIADRAGKVNSSKSQFSVWASSGSGASGTFATCYDMNSGMGGGITANYGWPTIEFTAQPRVVKHLWIANSSWVAAFYQGQAGDKFTVNITGKLRGIIVGTVDVALISGTMKVNDWKRVELSTLGEIDQLIFRVVSNDPMAPTYFCIDEIALKQIKK